MTASKPFFSICIPQYNRTTFLLTAIESFARQTFKDYEVCISDADSPDGRQSEIMNALDRYGIAYRFTVQRGGAPYDRNMREAIGLASGEYCLLMGNDDMFQDDGVLARLAVLLGKDRKFGVLIPDFEDYSTRFRAHRIRETCEYAGTPETAAARFRNFSFVSGIVLAREAAQLLRTDKWDGSEMYQTYVGCRLIANGAGLLEVAEALIRKDICIEGASRVGSYASKPKLDPCPIEVRALPLNDLGRVVCDALRPAVEGTAKAKQLNFRVLWQLLTITYPFWLFEYRRVQSWRYALGIALGMRPARCAKDVELGWVRRSLLHVAFAQVTIVGLLAPIGLFRSLQPALYRLAKSTS